jgi:hypothetical protein
MVYGLEELRHAKPFADALVSNPTFKAWVLKKTKFAEHAHDAQLLHREILARRRRGTKYWWRSHYTESCRCFGCSGQETDLLAIFETAKGLRFAIHIEVKHPKDGFTKGGNQAAAYPVRALCWVSKTPPAVLPHTAATTGLLCSETKLRDYAPHLEHFKAVITFEDAWKNFPDTSAIPEGLLDQD